MGHLRKGRLGRCTTGDRKVVKAKPPGTIQGMSEMKGGLDDGLVGTGVKDVFFASMAHEMRTPLSAMIGYSEVMVDELHGPLNKTQKDHMNKIMASSRLLLSLVNDILDVSKIQAGIFETQRTPFDLEATVRDVKDLFGEDLRRRGLTLYLHVPRPLPHIESDELRVKQVLMNIVSNAMKFSHEGGRIDLRIGKRSRELLISVKDHGIGMSRDELEHVFEPFWQADAGGSRGHIGTGLGLFISKRLVELLGGRITFESEKGRGTTVRFTLPMSAK